MEHGVGQCVHLQIAHDKFDYGWNGRNGNRTVLINHFEWIEADVQFLQMGKMLKNVRIQCVDFVVAQIQHF